MSSYIYPTSHIQLLAYVLAYNYKLYVISSYAVNYQLFFNKLSIKFHIKL